MKRLKIFCLLGMVSCVAIKSVYASDLIVCQDELCSVVQPQVNRTQYLNHIKSMLLSAPNGRIDFCEASPKTHLCQTDALRWQTFSDTNKFNMTIPTARINIVNNDVALDYVVDANNSYPRCLFSPLKLSVLPNKTIQIVSYVYNCNLLETEPANIQKILTVDFVDLDHKVIGGSYLIQTGGALHGEVTGYALMQLRDAKTSLPLVAKRYRNKAPSVPIPIIPQQIMPQYPLTPLWNDNEDAIFGNWNSRENVYPPILDTDLIDEDEIKDVSLQADVSKPETPSQTLTPEPQEHAAVPKEPAPVQETVETPSVPTEQTEEVIEEKVSEPEPAPVKPTPTASSILDDLLYTLPFDWLDDSQNAEESYSLFDPALKQPTPPKVQEPTTVEQPKQPQIIPVAPQEIILLVPSDPVVPPMAAEPVYKEPERLEPKEQQIDIPQKRQNIFVKTPQKQQPKKSIWERIKNAAVNMIYFEPAI